MEILNVLNTYNGGLMVIITFVYVVATIFICIANLKSAKATREQVAESKRQFDEENRAFVTVTFELIKTGIAVLKIQNLGKRIANNVSVSIPSNFINNVVDAFYKDKLNKLCNSTFTLGVGQNWYICIGSHLNLKEYCRELLVVDIAYEDNQGNHQEHIEIDLGQYFWAIIYESPLGDINQQMNGINQHLKVMERTMEKMKDSAVFIASTMKENNKDA